MLARVQPRRALALGFFAALVSNAASAWAQNARDTGDQDIDTEGYDVRNAPRTMFIATSSLDEYIGTRTTGGYRHGPAPFSAADASIKEIDLTVTPEFAVGPMSLLTIYAGATGTASSGVNGGTLLARGIDFDGGGFVGLIFSPWERDMTHRERWSLNARVEHDWGDSVLVERALDSVSVDPTMVSLINGASAIGPGLASVLVPFQEWHARVDLAGADVAARDWYLQGAVGIEFIHRTYAPLSVANALTSTTTWAAPRLGLALGWRWVQLEYQLTVSTTTFAVGQTAQPPSTLIPRTDNLIGLDLMWPVTAHLQAGVAGFIHFGVRNDGPLVQEETAGSILEGGGSLLLHHVF